VTELPALEMTDISKRFGSTAALDGASITVRRGTVHGLLGENGAGKTTLMGIAYGLLRADSGLVRIDGRELSLDSPSAAIAAGVGMVHQHPENVPAMSVGENLELGRRGVYRASAIRASTAELARRVGFTLDVDARVGTLSVAAQQRLEILKAISRNARLLILDEPTAVLAPAEAKDLLDWLRAFASRGGTAVIITHRLEEVRAYADDLTVLRRGRTVLARAASDTTTSGLAEAMIGSAPTAEPHAPGATPTQGAVIVRVVTADVQDSRKHVAIRAASFEIRGGEVVGVVGVEGSGHHELLLALARRTSLARGSITLPERIAFVPEDRHRDAVVLSFSLAENLAIHGAGNRRGRMSWRSIEARMSTLARRFDIRARGPRDPMTALSGGNQQKAVLARELESDPDLIVLENPTRGLDIRAAAFMRAEVRTRRDAGAAVVLYSSDLDEVIEIADRVLVVYNGTVRSMRGDRGSIGAAMLGAAE
jgi:general nucleoside transport system ATP-binding protein